MYFPALISGLRHLRRWLVYEVFQLALWGAYALHTLGSLRSALGGEFGLRTAGPAIRPRRPVGPARGGRFSHSAAA